jgi:hypothetical protein
MATNSREYANFIGEYSFDPLVEFKQRFFFIYHAVRAMTSARGAWVKMPEPCGMTQENS